MVESLRLIEKWKTWIESLSQINKEISQNREFFAFKRENVKFVGKIYVETIIPEYLSKGAVYD